MARRLPSTWFPGPAGTYLASSNTARELLLRTSCDYRVNLNREESMSRCVGLLVLLVSCLVLTNNGIVSNAAVFASQDSASGNALSRIPPCGNGFRS